MYFNGCNTIEELKKTYRRLCMENHPDLGGDLEIMKAINAEYDSLFNLLKDRHNTRAAEEAEAEPDESKRRTRPINETPEEYRRIILELLKLDGLTIELCGSWLWISGNTFAHKACLKEIGCMWAKKKSMWYWRPAEEAAPRRGKSMSMSHIRAKYGSDSIRDDRAAVLPA